MRVAVLASGEGTNLQALLDHVHGREGTTIVAVASDKRGARALERARAAGVDTEAFLLGDYADRGARDEAMAAWLTGRGAELVVLAGYMRLLSPGFLRAFDGRVINVHPALLPAFPGLHAVEQALAYGVKVFGVTVHFVDDGVDTGPVILQRAIELPDARSAEEVLERLHPIEHELLAEAVRLIAREAATIDPTNPRRVVLDRGAGALDRGAGALDRGAGALDRGVGALDRGAGALDRGADPVRSPTPGNVRSLSAERRGRRVESSDQMEQASRSPSVPVEPSEVQVTRALLSVSDKTGIVEFARGLVELGIEIVSTGGTAGVLADAGIQVRSITDFTGFPEIMDGRVKTLHPKLYAGVLAVRDNRSHLEDAGAHDVEFVDLVCVNLYPFERTAARRGIDEREVIENIDIGGPTMIRAAAKNWQFVAPVVSPASYDAVLAELRESDRRLSANTRESLAAEAFAYTARYDTAIARWFQEKGEGFPPLLVRAFERLLELPYGENPHQRAAYYEQVGARTHVLSMVSQLGGKQLSFNNLLDLDAARRLVSEFTIPACVIVKHGNPCGVAVGTGVLEAYRRAFASDPMSAFGGIVCLNRRIDKALAEELVAQFIEVLFAPGYDEDALEVLSAKKNMRILDDRERRNTATLEPELRQVAGGLLVQDRDSGLEDRDEMEVVSERRPAESEWEEALFAWRVCKHVRSNAIVLSRELATIGVGAGQMSRVDSVRLALEKARATGASTDGAALASDAYFPFADGPELALEAGVSVIIQPGGSIRDELTVDAVNKAGAAMIFTSRRHFRH